MAEQGDMTKAVEAGVTAALKAVLPPAPGHEHDEVNDLIRAQYAGSEGITITPRAFFSDDPGAVKPARDGEDMNDLIRAQARSGQTTIIIEEKEG